MDIICINDSFTPEQIADIPNRPIKDKMYTIRDIVKSANGIGLLLNKIYNSKTAGWVVRCGVTYTFEPNFSINRFTDLHGNQLSQESVRQSKFSEV